MISIPINIFLVVYFAFLVFFVISILTNIAHLVHTGTLNFFSFVITLFVIAFSLIVLWSTWYYLRGIDWRNTAIHLNFTNSSFNSIPGNNL